jgi:hypothetical protein
MERSRIARSAPMPLDKSVLLDGFHDQKKPAIGRNSAID